ncbi:hypothetical protein ACFV3R_15710 [Streptomyces sp. NPDC059740]|uniref:hypothetical protein n=1 Tax=Streptomyces sp. NPDC059740 TaxID=3346926 RepID=UPI00364E4A7E
MPLFRHRASVTVLRDLEIVRSRLESALAEADPELAPGLRYALDVVTELDDERTDLRTEWARGVLETEGVDPRAHEVRAVKALRDARPGLSLRDAVEMVKAVLATEH